MYKCWKWEFSGSGTILAARDISTLTVLYDQRRDNCGAAASLSRHTIREQQLAEVDTHSFGEHCLLIEYTLLYIPAITKPTMASCSSPSSGFTFLARFMDCSIRRNLPTGGQTRERHVL